VSDQLVRTRLLSQLQLDQRSLFVIQNQLSSGQRIALPSEDAPAAQRAITLQGLIERKVQVQTNLTTNLSYLNATDASLNSVSSLLNDVRGAALGVVDTTSTDAQRAAVAAEVRRALDQLVDTANQNFRGRYLFAGTRTTVQPFELLGTQVVYHGNEGELKSFSDIDVLFESSVSGNAVFGALSEAIRGTADLTPALTLDTRLTDLNGGLGVSQGAIAISDGTTTSKIDLSGAKTIGDVAQFIEQQPPNGRSLTVSISATGLVIGIDSAGGGNLTVTEVGGGTLARELGILQESGNLTLPVVGGDLNPRLSRTTSLDDILGARAQGRLISAGKNNDLLIEAAANGDEFNGTRVQLVDDRLLQAAPGVAQGSEFAEYDTLARSARASLHLSGLDNDIVLTANMAGLDFNNVKINIVVAGDVKDSPTAVYDSGLKTITLGIDDSDETTLAGLVAAIEANTPFSVSPDGSLGEGFDGAAAVLAVNAGIVTGNTGNSGGEAGTLYVHIERDATTAIDVAQAINNEGAFRAEVDRRDALSLSQAGAGIVEIDAVATTTGGAGEVFDRDSGILVTSGGQEYEISFATAESIEDVLNILNGSPANLLAEVNASGTGVDVRSRLSGGDFAIGENGGQTASQLGIRTLTEATSLAELNRGRGVLVADGLDFTIQRRDGATLDIDVSSAITIGDVLDLINSHVDNQDPNAVVARLTQFGNGIELVDDNTAGIAELSVIDAQHSQAAIDLGLIPVGETVGTGPGGSITGRDVNPSETEGVFNTLIRLQQALLAGDVDEIGRALGMLDTDLERVNFTRAEVGARQQGLEVLQTRLESEEIELRSSLSVEIDVDITKAISDLTARQISFEASLRTTAEILQLSLLNFI
jgi:flagellin-like hook-associated protein FlgL